LHLDGLALYWSFSSDVGLHNPPANGKQGQIPEETLLTNKKQGNLD
jgi:hypothetical protein